MDDLAGKQLGSYRIVAPIGVGGMAAVYRAYQASMDRYVAVKVLPRQMAASPQFTARFENEARLLARLQHPHILPVFDFGQAEGYAYFVMPLVETGTLADRLRGRPLPVRQLSQFIVEIGSALEYAHNRGLLHRDVKPSNILLDEGNNTLLTDFGIAKLLDGSAKFTATGVLVGTPAYMSPEQGRGHSLDRRSDIYALGVILFELATSQVPFNAETPVAIIYQHIHDPLPAVEALNPNLPDGLVRAIYKALAKQPDERFQTAREMAEAVEAAALEPYRPPPPATPQPPTLVEPVLPEPTQASAPAPEPAPDEPVAPALPPAPLLIEATPPAGPLPAEPVPDARLDSAPPITAPPSGEPTPPPAEPLPATVAEPSLPRTPPPTEPLPPANPTIMGGGTRRSAVLAAAGVGALVLVGLIVLALVVSPWVVGLLATATATNTAAPTATLPAATTTAAPTATTSGTATEPLPPDVLAAATVLRPEGSVVMRDAPNGSAILNLPDGTTVHVLSTRQTTPDGTGWVQIRLPDSGETGWVPERQLKYTTTPPS